jgi:hypothetical protein
MEIMLEEHEAAWIAQVDEATAAFDAGYLHAGKLLLRFAMAIRRRLVARRSQCL